MTQLSLGAEAFLKALSETENVETYDIESALEAVRETSLESILSELDTACSTYLLDETALADAMLAALQEGVVGDGEMIDGKRCVTPAVEEGIYRAVPKRHVSRAFMEAGYLPSRLMVDLEKSSCTIQRKIDYLLSCGRADDAAVFFEAGFTLPERSADSLPMTRGHVGVNDPVVYAACGDDLEAYKRFVDLDTGMRFVVFVTTDLDEKDREALLYALRAGLIPAVQRGISYQSDIRALAMTSPLQYDYAVQAGLLIIARSLDAELIDAAAAAIENSEFSAPIYLDARLADLPGREDLRAVVAKHPSLVDPEVVVQGELWCEKGSPCVVLPEGVRSIQPYAFSDPSIGMCFTRAKKALGLGDQRFEEIALPSTLIEIGERAFFGNVPKVIRLPKSLESIGRGSLQGVSKVYIYDRANEKLKAPKKADSQHKHYRSQIYAMLDGSKYEDKDCDIVVLDMDTDEVKFRFFMPLKNMSECAGRTLKEMWKNVATFRFHEFDYWFETTGLNKTGKIRNAFYRLAYPLQLVDGARPQYMELLNGAEKTIDKLIRELLMEGDVAAVKRFSESLPMKPDQAERHMKAIMKSKALSDEHRGRCIAFLESAIS